MRLTVDRLIPCTAIVIMASLFCFPSAAADERVFTVEDSISLEKLVNLEPTSLEGGEYAKMSPSGDYFVILTRRGDLVENVNVDTLKIFSSDETRRFVENQNTSIQPIRSYSFTSRDNYAAVRRIRWVDDSTLGFIARDERGVSQIFISNVPKGNLAKLSSHPSDVVNFNHSNNTLLYYALAPEELITADEMLGERGLFELISPNHDESARSSRVVELYVKRSGEKEAKRIDAPRVRLHKLLTDIRLSPTGAYAVVQFPPVNAPDYWSEYKKSSPDVGIDTSATDPTSSSIGPYSRHMIVDVEMLTVKPLLDAPTGVQLNWNRHARKVFWSADGAYVIVTFTFLPLSDVSQEERELRKSSTAIAEIEVSSGAITRIVAEPLQTRKELREGAERETITDVEFDPETNELVITKRVGSTNPGERIVFRKDRNVWMRSSVRVTDHSSTERSDELIVFKEEGVTRPPVLVAKVEGAARIILEPTRNKLERATGAVTAVSWVDKVGVKWTGGVMLPLNCQDGVQYPLIVQTHGFNEDEFLIDGPGGVTGPFAAQAFASRGFVVLQVKEPFTLVSSDGDEGPNIVAGIKAGVESVVDKGIVDRGKIGLIGWSRTALHALYAIVEEPDLFAAVTIADGIQYGYMTYQAGINSLGQQGFREMGNMNGAEKPYGSGLEQWVENSPLFHLDQVRAAVRVEPFRLTSLVTMWETYAVLKDLGKAADLVYLPDATHVIFKPQERLISQKGNLQWFLFWLQGVEEKDPVHPDQYIRWRAMRETQCERPTGNDKPWYCNQG